MPRTANYARMNYVNTRQRHLAINRQCVEEGSEWRIYIMGRQMWSQDAKTDNRPNSVRVKPFSASGSMLQYLIPIPSAIRVAEASSCEAVTYLIIDQKLIPFLSYLHDPDRVTYRPIATSQLSFSHKWSFRSLDYVPCILKEAINACYSRKTKTKTPRNKMWN
jgi:hypothetical protein